MLETLNNLEINETNRHFEDDISFVHNKFVELHTEKPWSLYEIRFLYKVISKLKPNNKDIMEKNSFPLLSFTKSEYQGFIKSSQNDYFSHNKLQKFADQFQQRKMNIASEEEKAKGGFENVVIFPLCRYSPDEGMLYVEIHNKMIPYFIDFEDNYLFVICNHLYLIHDWRGVCLYIMLRRYVYHCKKNGVIELTLSHIKGVMGISDQYKTNNYNFINKVIDAVVNDLNSKDGLDIHISYEPIKLGRQIQSICFRVETKDNYYKYAIPENRVIKDGLSGKILEKIPDDILKVMYYELCIATKKIKVMIQTYGCDYIRNKIALLEFSINKNNIPNPAGFLIEAIKNNYTVPAVARYSENKEASNEIENRWQEVELFCEKYTGFIELIFNTVNNQEVIKEEYKPTLNILFEFIEKNKDLSTLERPILTLFVNNKTQNFIFLNQLFNFIKNNSGAKITDSNNEILSKIKKYKALLSDEEYDSPLIELYKEKISSLLDQL